MPAFRSNALWVPRLTLPYSKAVQHRYPVITNKAVASAFCTYSRGGRQSNPGMPDHIQGVLVLNWTFIGMGEGYIIVTCGVYIFSGSR